MKNNNKVAVFILLGQSNAVGHGIPMVDEDKICTPLKNVFGLTRSDNQSFENKELKWSGYTSGGMNLAEEQDHTYSIANCLARAWQDEIDSGNKSNLPDLYIVQIAIGSQGVTEGYMWNPDYEKKLIPGKLGEVKISLYPYTTHILSLVKESLNKIGKTPEVIQLHWRGGENDMTTTTELLKESLEETYHTIFDGFYKALGEKVPTILHKLVCHEWAIQADPSGGRLERMHYINEVFETLEREYDNISGFDACNAPNYVPDEKGNGLFIEDLGHYTAQTNKWVAEQILNSYK